MKVSVYTLRSFPKTEKGGNPAGVVLDADSFSDVEMQKIATQVGYSETAFVKKSNKADYKVRFFAPDGEVDLCGHATIATFFLLRKLGLIADGIFTQETKSGILKVEVNQDKVLMEQALPQFCEIIDRDEVAKSLNLNSDQFISNLPCQVVSTGLRDLLVPVNKLTDLLVMKPNFDEISRLSQKSKVIGLHVFSLETKFSATAHCRNFFPLYGIEEESATGTSNGALACYLYNYDRIDSNKVDNMIFEQGYSMDQPSEIIVKLTVSKEKIQRVEVGGTATSTGKKEVLL